MKITDLKCAVIGGFPVVRITTDAGIDGIGQAENWKPNLKPHILYYREMILGFGSRCGTNHRRRMLRTCSKWRLHRRASA